MKNKTFFGGTIKANHAMYLKTAISFMVFVRTINWNGNFFDIIISMSPSLMIFVYPIGAIIFLIVMNDYLDKPAIK